MGRPKLSLPFGDETMLQRVVRLLASVVSPIAVVAATGQELPELPAEILIERDDLPNSGPLVGIGVGLKALADRVDAAFVTSCDVPLLQPMFVSAMTEKLAGHDIVVPVDDEFTHPLGGVYRTALWQQTTELIKQDRRRPLTLIEESLSLRVPVAELRIVDPQLDSLRNLNTPEDYEAALKAAGL